MKRRICPICKEQGLKSQLTPNGGSRNGLAFKPYYDEEGVFHSHDPNIINASFSCSNGHDSWCSYYVPCPNCDYGKSE